MEKDKVKLTEIIKEFNWKKDGHDLMSAAGYAAVGWLPLIVARMVAVNKFGADLFPLSWLETFYLLTGTLCSSAMSAATLEAMIHDIKNRVR